MLAVYRHERPTTPFPTDHSPFPSADGTMDRFARCSEPPRRRVPATRDVSEGATGSEAVQRPGTSGDNSDFRAVTRRGNMPAN